LPHKIGYDVRRLFEKLIEKCRFAFTHISLMELAARTINKFNTT
jgi:hypothetical protein